MTTMTNGNGFLLTLSGLLAKVAMADGDVTSDEVATAERMFADMNLTQAENALCVGNFMMTQRKEASVESLARDFAAASNHVTCRFLYRLLLRIAFADWRVSEGEERVLGEIGVALGLSEEERDQLRRGADEAFDSCELEACGVPSSLMNVTVAGGGIKDGGLGIWDN